MPLTDFCLQIRFRVDIIAKCNDGWLNSHNSAILKVWRTNMDFRLVIDASKLKIYMTKYVTKSEGGPKGSIQNFLKFIIKQCMKDLTPTAVIIRKIMTKLMGERTMCVPECCHLLLSEPLYHCTHRYGCFFVMSMLCFCHEYTDVFSMVAINRNKIKSHLCNTVVCFYPR